MQIPNTLSETHLQLMSGKLSAENLTLAYLEQIEKIKHLNAYVCIWNESALSKAKQIDEKIKTGKKLGKLFGAVVSIKDNICYKNHNVSAASKILKNYISPYNATVVQRLLDEDAIIIGSTNCDEFGMGSSSTNSIYGSVKNGEDNSKIAGGSSGGAAVSVQMNTCLFALGSDTGGSIRQPAALCNVIGFKPSYGSISRHGLIAYASSFDQIGIISKDMVSISRVYESIKGPDDYDGTVVLDDATNASSHEIKIAGLAPIVEQANDHVRKTLDMLETVSSVDYLPFEFMDYMVPCYYILTTAEASSNLSRYDGVRYGHRSNHVDNLEDLYKNSRTEGFGDEVKKRIMLGTFVLSEGYFDAYYAQAQKVRRLIVDSMDKILVDCDVIAMPVITGEPRRLDQSVSDALEIYMSDIFTVLANLTGMPSIAIPMIDQNGFKTSIQLMCKQGHDQRLLDIAKDFYL